MKISFSGLFLVSVATIFTIASPVAKNSLDLMQSAFLTKRHDYWNRGYAKPWDNNSSKYGREEDRLGRERYYRFGKYWDFNNRSDNNFIIGLRHPPNIYYGQRFQFLYQNLPRFRRRWDSDRYFRSSWNSDLHFRNSWFASIYPHGYDSYRQGRKFYRYHNRGMYSRGRFNMYNGNFGLIGYEGADGNGGNDENDGYHMHKEYDGNYVNEN
ncbi:hypothetical protein AYI68_g244 [Smittium mucronatum]|uniref:Uncharacterized protein n=1 Tax=Smittium mucronatum TaxID=133383 RepID=A0A1R0H8X9_9FUNG|nr:hypothetical protein AYI68_g244 [Smittium mucronatum]